MLTTGADGLSVDTSDTSSGTPGEDIASVVERCGWTLVWLVILLAGLGFWGAWSSWPWAAAGAPLLVLAGVAGTGAAWLVKDPSSPSMRLAGVAGSLVTVIVPQVVGIHGRQFATTDSAAFNQVAANALAHGRNPYTSSMGPAAQLLQHPAQYWTYLVSGGHVSHVSYPAGSFLLDVPAILLGFHHEVVDWVDLGAWVLTGVLIVAAVPAALRWFTALVLLTPLYIGMFSNGGTDALFLPFLVVAVWGWDRFGTGRCAGPTGWIGPVALGLACSVKQTPWFCVPLLVIGVFLEARNSGRRPWSTGGRYLALVAGAFVAVNLPFIVWDPVAWWNGTLLPLTQPLVADGQGVVSIALHGLTGGVVLPLLSVSGALVYLALVAGFVTWYPAMKRAWLFLLPVVLFVPARSLSNYLVDLLPVAVVAALTARAASAPPEPVGTGTGTADKLLRRWWGPVAVALPLTAAAVAAVVAFTSAPLELSVDSFRTSNATQQLDSVTVTVHNRTDHTVTPHFMVEISTSHPDGFWNLTAGAAPLVLDPGASRTVTLVPVGYTWSPIRGAYWLVQAYTSAPEALSTSPLQVWRLGRPQ